MDNWNRVNFLNGMCCILLVVEIRRIMPKMYYCTECKKNHKSGKIYRDHMKYKFVEKPVYDCEVIQQVDFLLRLIARRQIARYKKKIKTTPFKRSWYVEKINELIEYEKKREEKIKYALS